MKENIASIIKWHEETFPDATLEGQLDKFEEELAEYNGEENMWELVDMFIVACGVARFDCVSAIECFGKVKTLLMRWKKLGVSGAFGLVLDEKMEINRNRVWSKTSEGLYHHICTDD